MTAATRRQVAMLVVLAGALAALLYVRRPPGAVADAPVAAPGATTSQRSLSDGAPVAGLRLEALDRHHREIAAPERNPFRFEARREPQQAAPAPVRRPELIAPPAPTGPTPPPPIPLKFIGVIDAPARIGTVAILSDSRGNVFYGKEGDIIEGRYRVLKIGADAAEVAYADGRGRQTIRLSGQ